MVCSCVQLLRHGANLHHFSRRPEGTTALHEAVARGNLKVAELLLQYGANPFMENGRWATAWARGRRRYCGGWGLHRRLRITAEGHFCIRNSILGNGQRQRV